MFILKWLDEHFEECIMMVLMCIMVAIMTLQVFMRYVMNNSLSWPEEMTRYLFIWFVFLGISYAIKYDRHLRVDILLNYLPERFKKKLLFIDDVLFLVFAVYLIKPSLRVIQKLIETYQVSPALRMPMYIVYLGLLVGILLTLLRLIQKFISSVFLAKNNTKS
jgi:TRAP-type C4-dicarboxylate transport system permease small subunit